MNVTKNATVMTFANQKGGVGKTMSVLNVGVGLARYGYKVLLIDIDAQSNLTMGLGYDPDELENTISKLFRELMENASKDQEQFVDKYIFQTKESVDLLPGDTRLSGTEALMQAVSVGRSHFLSNIVDKVRKQYDYILIDCPPSLGILTINALVAADQVIIPSQAQIFSYKGSELLIQNIEAVKRINKKLKYGGIILTMINPRGRDARAIIAETEESYGRYMKIFKNRVPASVKASESNKYSKSIFAYDPKGKIAKAYDGIVKEIIDDQEK